mgnify:CR=1 FL=1
MMSLATSVATRTQRAQIAVAAGVLVASWLLALVPARLDYNGYDAGWIAAVVQLMAAYLVLSQLFQLHSPAIAVIAAGYVFQVIATTLPIFMISEHFVRPVSLEQTIRAHDWLSTLSHFTFLLFFVVYALFDNYLEHIKLTVVQSFATAVLITLGGFVLAVVAGIVAIAWEGTLSGVFGVSGLHLDAAGSGVPMLTCALAAATLVMFVYATRLRTLTQLFLALGLLAMVLADASRWLTGEDHHTMAWALAQWLQIASAAAIPILYVFELHWVYARLAHLTHIHCGEA